MAETNEENTERVQPPSRTHGVALARQRALRMNANNGTDDVSVPSLSNLNIRADNIGQVHLETRNDNLNAYSDEDYDYVTNSGNLNGWTVAEVVDGTPPNARSLVRVFVELILFTSHVRLFYSYYLCK